MPNPSALKLYRLKNPDYFDKAVAAYSDADARKLVGGHVELIDDGKLLKKLKRRPGMVFQKLAGMKKDWHHKYGGRGGNRRWICGA